MITWDNRNLFCEVTSDQFFEYNWTQLVCSCWYSHQDVYDFVEKNAKELDQAIEYDRDLGYDYFGAFAYTCIFCISPWYFCCCNLELGLWFFLYEKDLIFRGFKTLEKSYLLRVHGKIVERPQHMIMRAACGIHCGDLNAALETYDLMSRCGPRLRFAVKLLGIFFQKTTWDTQ